MLKKRNQKCTPDEETIKINDDDGSVKMEGDKLFTHGKSSIIHSNNISYCYHAYSNCSMGCNDHYKVSKKHAKYRRLQEKRGPPTKVWNIDKKSEQVSLKRGSEKINPCLQYQTWNCVNLVWTIRKTNVYTCTQNYPASSTTLSSSVIRVAITVKSRYGDYRKLGTITA